MKQFDRHKDISELAWDNAPLFIDPRLKTEEHPEGRLVKALLLAEGELLVDDKIKSHNRGDVAIEDGTNYRLISYKEFASNYWHANEDGQRLLAVGHRAPLIRRIELLGDLAAHEHVGFLRHYETLHRQQPAAISAKPKLGFARA